MKPLAGRDYFEETIPCPGDPLRGRTLFSVVVSKGEFRVDTAMVMHTTLSFQHAHYHQEPDSRKGALSLGQLTPPHPIDHAVLILKRGEGNAASGLRPPTADHHAGYRDVAPRRDAP